MDAGIIVLFARMAKMLLVATCWYLCGLFLIALACASLITVAPGGETAMAVAMVLLLAFASAAGLFAVLLNVKFRRTPHAPIFKSRLLARFAVGVAIVLTLVVISGVIG